MASIVVEATGPLTTLQDLGRPGYAHLGVPRSGAADRGALRLANRLVGNPESAAALEVTLGGLRVRARGEAMVAVTGPPTSVRIDGRAAGDHAMLRLPDGAELRIEPPARGCRNYLAVRGGFTGDPVLGSLATDTLSGLGPAPLRPGTELTVGEAPANWPATDLAPAAPLPGEVVELAVVAGPRRHRLVDPAALYSGVWQVNPASNRIGVRLDRHPGSGPELRHRDDLPEPESEGVPLGAVQVPPSGQPVIFLADHPTTGGYPVVAVLTAAAVDLAAQLTAGDRVRLRAY